MLDTKHKSSDTRGMNKLPLGKRVQILSMLCEGSSLRSTSRVCDVSINTVSKILVDAGKVCAAYHDQYVRGLTCKRVQCDEIWSFCYSKDKNVKGAKMAPEGRWERLDVDGLGCRYQADLHLERRRSRCRERHEHHG